MNSYSGSSSISSEGREFSRRLAQWTESLMTSKFSCVSSMRPYLCAKSLLGAWRPSRWCGYCNAIAVDIFHSTELPRGAAIPVSSHYCPRRVAVLADVRRHASMAFSSSRETAEPTE